MKESHSTGPASSAEHSRIGELFLAVCDLEPSKRTSFLDTACGDDTRLRREIERLLEQDSCIRNLLERTEGVRPDNLPLVPLSEPHRVDPFATRRKRPGGSADDTGSGASGDTLPTIPGYELLDRIGQGGMGVVFRARQLELKRTVALKLLPGAIGSARPELVERFRREAAAAARLKHKNIVPVYDFGVAECGHFYSMEWIQGCSLDVLIAELADSVQNKEHHDIGKEAATSTRGVLDLLSLDERPFSAGYYKRVALWMVDTLSALTCAHERGVLHRDIKPGNLIVASDGRIMVADFGLAKIELDESMTADHSIMGTLRYLSPEQLLGKRVPIDGRADLYSLGGTLYELLTLTPLFENCSREQLVSAIVTRVPDPPQTIQPSVPRDLGTICLKMLEKFPEARYADADAVAADLTDFLQGRPIRTRPPGLVVKTMRSARRIGLKRAAVAVFLVAAIVGSTQVFRLGQSRRTAHVTELVSKGLVAQQDHRWDDASAAYRTAIDLDPSNVRALGNLAIVLKELYNAGGSKDPTMLDEAIDYCDRALDVNPNHAGLWNVLGVLYKKTGDYVAAAESYQTALDVNDDRHPASRVAALNNLAEVQWLAGAWDAAEISLRASAALARETNTAAWYTYCDLASLELFYEHPAALEAIARAFKQKAEPGWRLHLIRARIRLELPGALDVDMALRDALAAQERSAPDRFVERTLAMAYLRSGKWNDAAQHAEKALEAGDTASFGLLMEGLARVHLGDTVAAAAMLQKAEAQWPTELAQFGYTITTERGMLWFDKESELVSLHNDLEDELYGR